MKRLCIQALVLCAMLMTVTATASAVGGTVSNLNIQQDANITIQPLTDAGTAITPTDGTYKEVSKFQITLNQTKQGGTYLVMVLSGDGLPTKDTLYWANILPGNGGKLDVKVNAKKSMGDGTYKVFLSSGETDKASLASLDYQTESEPQIEAAPVLIPVGETRQIPSSLSVNGAKIVWSSGAPDIVSVDENGKITAHKLLCSQNGIEPVEITATADSRSEKTKVWVYRFGDVDGNDKIQPYDALLTLKIDSGVFQPQDWQRQAANVDGVDKPSPYDALLILKKDAGLITTFPAQTPST